MRCVDSILIQRALMGEIWTSYLGTPQRVSYHFHLYMYIGFLFRVQLYTCIYIGFLFCVQLYICILVFCFVFNWVSLVNHGFCEFDLVLWL